MMEEQDGEGGGHSNTEPSPNLSAADVINNCPAAAEEMRGQNPAFYFVQFIPVCIDNKMEEFI